MRILVCGSRNYTDAELIRGILNIYRDDSPTIVHGDCRGADSIADHAALMLGYDSERWAADWKKHGRAAGPIRNRQMLDSGVDLVLAFGVGRGTSDCVGEATRRNIPVVRHP
jgi:predicted polyphosphate/ATP-dependent NAD kinase